MKAGDSSRFTVRRLRVRGLLASALVALSLVACGGEATMAPTARYSYPREEVQAWMQEGLAEGTTQEQLDCVLAVSQSKIPYAEWRRIFYPDLSQLSEMTIEERLAAVKAIAGECY